MRRSRKDTKFMKTILGIDPGIGTTGYGVIRVQGQDLELVGFGVISTPPNTPVPSRLVELEKDLVEIIKTYEPDLVSVEELVFVQNVTTGMAVSQARGVILLVCERAGTPITEFIPTQVKLAVTGYGRADKAQVQDMVCKLLKLDKRPTPDDAADALAIAICGASGRLPS